ncbi:hypothetical protein BJ508DRAFT_45122 [Ascobolus immersus RN42]|uniref:Kelch repeat protein n=1 Tax=Ascobolus immersus RN42 TaxID=1160509 RepID=A0A3N4HKL1_ASCIM|nr:hypothetical protein BJ508DRAFT_45122 [Ascobolus immersus RN42]
MKWGSFWSLGDNLDTLLLSQGELEYYRLVSPTDHNETLTTARSPAAGRIFSYTPSTDTWKVQPKPEGLTNSVSKIATTYSQKAGKGFFFGGQIFTNAYLDRGETRVGRYATTGANPVGNSHQNALVSFDAASNTWTNSTTALEHTEFGTLTALDAAGPEGLLLLLGGQSGAEQHQGGKSPPEWRTMEAVQVYDIASEKWYNQPTTSEGGFFPDRRTLHCTVAASAPDGSSHNVYMFGGQSDGNREFLRDVWVLSLPAFHWVNLRADLPAGISDAACGKVGERYLFSFGGRDSETPIGGDVACDEREGAVKLLDLAEGKWVEEYKAGDYEVPQAVYRAIGGDGKGGAKMVAPRGGWVDDGLKEVLAIKAVTPELGTSKPGLGSSGESGSDGQTLAGAKEESSGLSGGAIGGIVGGIIAALALVGVVFFLVKRRKRAGHQGVPSSSSSGVNELEARGGAAEYYTYKAPLGTGTEYSDGQAVEKDGSGTVRTELAGSESATVRSELPGHMQGQERVYHEMDTTGRR